MPSALDSATAHQPATTTTSPAGLPPTPFMTLKEIIGPGRPIPLSRQSWEVGVDRGTFPAPVRLGGRRLWKTADIADLIERIGRGELTQPLQPRRKVAA